MNSTARHLWILAVAAITGAAALLCLASCSHSKTSAELERISLLTEENPDSALSLLLAADTAAFADEAERACFAVALTNARYLAYDPTCSDSLLSLHAGYFADAPADRFKMLYLYLSATFKIERKQFTEAIIELFDAAQIAEASNDHLYAGRIYRGISDIYINMLNSSQSLKYCELALDNFEKHGNQRLINWQLIRIGQAYFNNGKYDKSIEVLQKTLENAIESSDDELIPQTKELLARDYMEKGDYRKAINTLQNLSRDYLVFDYYTLSYSYLNIDNVDSAKYFSDRLMELNANNREMSFRINKKLGNKDLAIDDLENEFNSQIKYYFNLTGENFIGIETNYFTELAAKSKKELNVYKYKLSRQLVITSFAILLFIILSTSLYFYHRRRLKFKESEIEKYSLLAKNLQIKFDKLSSDTSNSIKSDFSLINKLSQEFFLSDKSDTNKIYSKVQRIIEDYRSSDETLEQLEQDVDLVYDGLASRFKNELPEIYHIYNRLFLLIALDFDSQSIPTILGVTQRAYYNKKNRLVTILREETSDLSDLLLSALKSSRERKQNSPVKHKDASDSF